MLPFENRPWAKPVAIAIIVATVIFEVAVAFWVRRTQGPLTVADILCLVLFFVVMVPPNIHVLRVKRDATRRATGMQGVAASVGK